MQQKTFTPLSLAGQLLYASGSAAFTMLERLIILYAVFFFLPPEELGVHNLVPNRTYGGIITVLGAALLLGRIFDGIADPVIATLSDNSRARVGRRKLFLLLSGLPLTLTSALLFFPPEPDRETLLNGLWLALILCLFYIAFTAYVNPYLALISELGHTDSLRINLSTAIACFGLLGMVCVTVLFPELVSRLQDQGVELRRSYQLVAGGFAAASALILYAVTLGFDELKHGTPRRQQRLGLWESLRKTFGVQPFRIFLAGEVFLQFAMNLLTLGLLYYAVVIFRQDQRFVAVLGALTIGVAILSFPLVNLAAKKMGKKRVILAGVLILAVCSLFIFILSWRMSGAFYYLALAMFGLAGLPLAILTALINPTIADMARAEAFRTGERREAMFFGARAIPLKMSIALAGVTFTFLLSTFGKDIARPLGVQLSVLVVAVSSVLGYLFISRYPEQAVQALVKHCEADGPRQDPPGGGR